MYKEIEESKEQNKKVSPYSHELELTKTNKQLKTNKHEEH